MRKTSTRTDRIGARPAESSGSNAWGARARDWAEIEDENSRALFEAVFDATGVREGTKLLDVGCGSGLAGAIAQARGALVSGTGRLASAARDCPRARCPGRLPPRRHGVSSVRGWDSPEKVELTAYVAALEPLLPPSPVTVDPFIPRPELERLARGAGLEPVRIVELDWSWHYPDRETMLRGLLSPGLSTLAIAAAGEAGVKDALTSALEPFRMTDGRYRLENTVHCLIASA